MCDINLDSALGDGTHCVTYFKNKEKIMYFDRLGDSSLLIEIQNI